MGWDGGWRGERSCCSQLERAKGPRSRQRHTANENRLKELNKERGGRVQRDRDRDRETETDTDTDRQTDRQKNTEVGAKEDSHLFIKLNTLWFLFHTFLIYILRSVQ